VAGVAAPCIDNEVKYTADLAQRLKSCFAVVFAVVRRFKNFRSVKYTYGFRKIDLTESPVFGPLIFIPAEAHARLRYNFCVHKFKGERGGWQITTPPDRAAAP
jgi:hypothetical protein